MPQWYDPAVQPTIDPSEDLSHRKPPSDRAGFLYRLGIYFVGIAIGFMILGMFRARSAAEAKRREAERAAYEKQFAEPAPPAPSGTTAAPAQPGPEPSGPKPAESPR